MRLNQSRSISRDGAGRSAAGRAGDLLFQHSHDAAPVGRPRQFVELGKLLDPLVRHLQFEAAVVEHLAHGAAIQSHEGALSDREDKGKHGRDALGLGRNRQADRGAAKEEDRRQADHGERPGDDRLPGGHSQRAEPEYEKYHAQERKSDLRRRQQKTELECDVAGDLEDREIVVLEPVVEVGFRQHDKDRDQSDAGKEIGRRNDDRDGAGVAIDQQHRRNERVADALHGQHLAALAGPALQYFQRQADRRGRPVGALSLKQ